MPFIPHTELETKAMLNAIGVDSIKELFSEIPPELMTGDLNKIPSGSSEMELARELRERALKDLGGPCFIGAGSYQHHIPAAVWELTGRGEFMTAYTPYQAEASQGGLQLIYEYQSMMAKLMGMEVSNASLYDGSTSAAEAALMAVRCNRRIKSKRVLLLGSVNPTYTRVIHTLVTNQDIELQQVVFSAEKGHVELEQLALYAEEEFAAVIIQQPNFFGQLELVDQLTDWAHSKNALVIALVNPIAMALLKEPGQWGTDGADIVCGEGQPLGIPMASGGPYFGIFCSKKDYARQMPGRIVGRTVDTDGKQGFVLTLQAREQHIRRAKATSNICTNQGLAVTAATIYMSILGYSGLQRVAIACHHRLQQLIKAVETIAGVEVQFVGPRFHEVALKLPIPAATAIEKMAALGFQAGYDLGKDFSTLKNSLLVCTTETKSEQDIAAYQQALKSIIE